MNWLRDRHYRSRRAEPNYLLTYTPGESTLIDIDRPTFPGLIYRNDEYVPGPDRVMSVNFKSDDLGLPDLPITIPEGDVEILYLMGFDVTQSPVLGRGASATVFRGEANARAKRYYTYPVEGKRLKVEGKYWVETFESPVAIKFVHMRDVIADRVEAETMVDLQHKNIVDLYEVLVVERRLYLIMEYCSGGTLGKYLAKCATNANRIRYIFRNYPERLTQPMCESFIRQLFDGLLYLHGQGVLHSDIHAGNVLLVRPDTDPDNITLKYTDFGVTYLFSVTSGQNIQLLDLEALGRLMLFIIVKVFAGGDKGVNDQLNKIATNLIGHRYKTLADAEVELNKINGNDAEEV